MKELLKLKDLWTTLKEEEKPLVLYGTGTGAEKIKGGMDVRGIPLRGVFASPNYHKKESGVFQGHPILHLKDLQEALGEVAIVVAFGTAKPELVEDIVQLAKEQSLYAPDMPVAGELIFTKDYFKENISAFQETDQLWGDDLSRQIYREVLSYKLTGDITYLRPHTQSRLEMLNEVFDFHKEEVFVDAGAYKGDTIQEFLTLTGGDYRYIYGLEPADKNYPKLKENLRQLPRTHLAHAAAWDKEELLYFQQRSGRSGSVEEGLPNTRGVPIDVLVDGAPVTYIKYDVEGGEERGVLGSKETISRYAPKLLVSVYHRPSDLIVLPQLIKKIQPQYDFYLRRNPGLPAWDLNLLCKPKEGFC